ncbi:hypothetical protein [Pseudomonas viridiflava]|uniref:hypothetical protein n=1 Tax=Pseudomonas viridiflava TaxID=33069 RepID=UPI001F13550D|nr:hypothetical protein [Pseudomonas viridiflava]
MLRLGLDGRAYLANQTPWRLVHADRRMGWVTRSALDIEHLRHGFHDCLSGRWRDHPAPPSARASVIRDQPSRDFSPAKLYEIFGPTAERFVLSSYGKAQYICITKIQDCLMKRSKDETLSIRTSADIKQLLRMAAEKEHRSIASMMEVLILNYAQKNGFTADALPKDGVKKGSDGTH